MARFPLGTCARHVDCYLDAVPLGLLALRIVLAELCPWWWRKADEEGPFSGRLRGITAQKGNRLVAHRDLVDRLRYGPPLLPMLVVPLVPGDAISEAWRASHCSMPSFSQSIMDRM